VGQIADDLIAWADPWIEGEGIRNNLAPNSKAVVGTADWINVGLPTFETVDLGVGGAPAPSAEMVGLGLKRAFHAVADTVNDRAYVAVPVAEGRTYRFSLYAWLVATGGAGIDVNVRNSTGAVVVADSANWNTLGQWVRLDVDVMASETAIWRFSPRSVSSSGEWYWTGVLIEESNILGTYFDSDPFVDYLRAIGSMTEQVEELAFDWVDENGVEHEGYERLLDPDLAPPYVLPYLAQYVGETLPTGLEVTSPALAREWIKDQPNSRRGTIESIVRTAQRTLTGARTVVVHQRNPNEDSIIVHTLASETPDSARVLQDLRVDAVPADIVLSYSTIVGQTYNDLNVAVASYNAMNAAYPTYNAAASAVPTGTTYTRPPP
jgi:hypothetical protein